MPRRHCLHMMLLVFGATALNAVAEPTPAELEQQRARLQTIRKSPEQLARLRDNLKAFLEHKNKDAIVKLDSDLHALSAPKKERYWKVLDRYADWLDQLRKSDDKAYLAIRNAPDATTRLAMIRARRDREWMESQPRAQREQWANLQGEEAARYIAKLRQEERRQEQHWQMASLFWRELDSKQLLPMRISDFSYKPKAKTKDAIEINPVKEYVEHYLLPRLTPAEKKRLDDAEGRWPDYPLALVAIASKHPTALPPARLPTTFAELPKPVRDRFDKKVGGPAKVAAKVKKEIDQYEGPNFARKFAEIARREGVLPFGKFQEGNEYMASTFKTLTPAMQEFVEKKLLPAMKDQSADERKLTDSEGWWPDYPKTIQELSAKYNLRPPWHILPDSEKFHWDRYRFEKCREPILEKGKEKDDT